MTPSSLRRRFAAADQESANHAYETARELAASGHDSDTVEFWNRLGDERSARAKQHLLLAEVTP